mmetsp:Transcript_599/g.1100  ORF Transcript_599/g.1100 Transcript_599/m.1100 type:complete len:197 (-) Transcript_599:1661-2251(-)
MGKKMTATGQTMKASHWSFGSDDKCDPWSTSTDSFYRGQQNTSCARPVPQHDSYIPPTGKLSYQSESMQELSYHHSTLASDYEHRQAAYDRISASKTNYDLAAGDTISARSRFQTSTSFGLQQPGAHYFGESRGNANVQLNQMRKDLGYNFQGVAFTGRTVPKRHVGDKKCFDRPPPVDPPGQKFNIVTGKYDAIA